MPKIFLTPGPSQLYFTAQEHLRSALRENVPSISHRSKEFEKISAHTQEQIRLLFNVPEDFHLFYTSSATEAWERIAQNLLTSGSTHFVNGAFSKRFADIVDQCGYPATRIEAQEGTVPDIDKAEIPGDTELIAITHNETSTGAQHKWDDVAAVRKSHPDTLIALDIVSSAPDVVLDFNDFDTTYFSVQKGFGLPAGLGVWMVNERCIEKCRLKASAGHSTGSYHSISSYLSKSAKFQTPETPNVLGIYLLGKVAEDMNTKGMDMIRRETAYKAAVLYQAYQQSSYLDPFVKESAQRSRTTTVATIETPFEKLHDYMSSKGFIIGAGYGKYKNDHMRIANFPTHSKEQIEMVADYLTAFEG